jgi:hypothetical protein
MLFRRGVMLKRPRRNPLVAGLEVPAHNGDGRLTHGLANVRVFSRNLTDCAKKFLGGPIAPRGRPFYRNENGAIEMPLLQA